MVDDLADGAYSTVAVPPSPGISGMTLSVQSGEGELFPTAPFDAVAWPIGVQALWSNLEIVRVLEMDGDNITAMDRAQYGSNAQDITEGYQFANNLTKALLEQIIALAESAGIVDQVVAGTNITVDDTDPANPVVSATGGSSSVQWVDLGLVDLVSAIMDGPTTLYEMPEGAFLSSVRFTDDPDTVYPDNFPAGTTIGTGLSVTVAFGTAPSLGWQGYAGVQSPVDNSLSLDTMGLVTAGSARGPFAATNSADATLDLMSQALSAQDVIGALQMGTDGDGVRVAAITPWAASTNYDSPASNTVATPGVLQKCAILENGTIWINDGLTGISGGSAPDFAGNAGGAVADGGTPASVLADSPPSLPLTVVLGVNDEFIYTGGAGVGTPETFTVAPGIITTIAGAVAAMGAAIGSVSGEAFSTKITPSNSSGSILLTGGLNGDTITESSDDVAASLGFTANPDTFAGGSGIVWYDTTSAPPTVGAVHVVAEIVTPVAP